jgi:hypothetical protein
MAELDQVNEGAARHECERAAGELEGVDVGAHRLEQVLEMPATEAVVVGAADLGDSAYARLARPLVEPQKRESASGIVVR